MLVLLENKITAPFQPEQLPRYQARGENALDHGWETFHIGVLAPEDYLDRFDRPALVDATVSYEAIREWFNECSTSRAAHKMTLLTHAIEQRRRHYDIEPDETMTALHRHYWRQTR